ncbi:hypothetical protein V8C37DRAFT_396542 [Trichoderma ceciliae]
MAIDSAGVVSIIELIVYIPLLCLAAVVCIRHGFTRASGWIYTILLCVLRIIGAVCQLLTYTDHSTGLLKVTLIIDSIGISPLLLATLGMLSRFVDWVNMRGSEIFTVKQFRLIQLLVTVGLILSIVGGTSGSSSSDGNIEPATTSKVGIILYIVAFAAMIYILFISSSYKTIVPKQERQIILAVGIAVPFILTRLIYSVLAIFLNNHTFSVLGGDIGVRVAMAVIEEFVVTFDYVLLGFTLHKLDADEQGNIGARPWKDTQRRDRGSRNRSRQDRGSRDRGSRNRGGEDHGTL